MRSVEKWLSKLRQPRYTSGGNVRMLPRFVVIFDTDVLIWYLRGHEKARRFIEDVAHERRAVSSLTFMELLQGCRNQEERLAR